MAENLATSFHLTRPEELQSESVWRAQQRWREVYSSGLHSETGRWTYNGYDWHIFSYGFCPSISGAHAEEEPRKSLPDDVWILADVGNLRQWGRRGVLESFSLPPAREDVIVVSLDLSWTLTLTHELNHGPYFSRRIWADPA